MFKGGFLRRRSVPGQVYSGSASLRRWRKFLWLIIVLFLGSLVWVGGSGYLAINQITAKNVGEGVTGSQLDGTLKVDDLRREGDGRVNILVLGIGGANHKGGLLADTIQILSLDPVNKRLALVSIPRDLYVEIPSNGQSKINAVYAYGTENCRPYNSCSAGSDSGGEAVKRTVEKTFDLPIHNFIRLDFVGFEKIIDALGGVKVYLEKPLYDPHYPDSRLEGFEPLYIPSGLQPLNGQLALKYVRSRQSTSDFDRSRRQQQVIAAVKEKAGLTVLANPKQLSNLLNILGKHLRTDLTAGEITKLITLIRGVKPTDLTSTVLDTGPDSPLMAKSNSTAGYIIIPRLGLFNFLEVRDYLDGALVEPYLIKENARVLVRYPPAKQKEAQLLAKKLGLVGYNVVGLESVSTKVVKATVEGGENFPYTRALLKKRLLASLTARLPDNLNPAADLVLTLPTNFVIK